MKIRQNDRKNLCINHHITPYQAQINPGPAIHQNADHPFMNHHCFVRIFYKCALCGQFMKQPTLQSATGIGLIAPPENICVFEGGAEKRDDPTVQMATEAAPPSSTPETENARLRRRQVAYAPQMSYN